MPNASRYCKLFHKLSHSVGICRQARCKASLKGAVLRLLNYKRNGIAAQEGRDCLVLFFNSGFRVRSCKALRNGVRSCSQYNHLCIGVQCSGYPNNDSTSDTKAFFSRTVGCVGLHISAGLRYINRSGRPDNLVRCEPRSRGTHIGHLGTSVLRDSTSK